MTDASDGRQSSATQSWSALALDAAREDLAARLQAFSRKRRWFRAKTQKVEAARLVDLVPLDVEDLDAATNVLAVLEIRYENHPPDLYVVPLTWMAAGEAASLAKKSPHAVIAKAGGGARQGLEEGVGEGLVDGLADGLATGSAAVALFALVRAGAVRRGLHGELRAEKSEVFDSVVGASNAQLAPRVSAAEQTNSTVMFGDRALLKVYRQLAEGPNPELEMGQFLSRACEPPCVPRVLGALTYTADGGEGRSLGIVHELIANHGDAWALAARELGRFFEQAVGTAPAVEKAGGGAAWLAVARAHAGEASPAGRFVALAATLGRRTGELHLALAGKKRLVPESSPDFDPEPLRAQTRRALVNRARAMLDETLSQLAAALQDGGEGALSPGARRLAERLLSPGGRQTLERLLERFATEHIAAVATRTHGDLHLGQVLAIARRHGPPVDSDEAVDDFVIIDFEGEPARPLAERRAKSSPLRDVMGMARSFDYAPEAALRAGSTPGGAAADRAGWGKLWSRDVTASYLRSYLDTVGDAPFIPRDPAELASLLTFYELEKVIYEVGYELNNRPAWVDIPLAGLAAVAGMADKDA